MAQSNKYQYDNSISMTGTEGITNPPSYPSQQVVQQVPAHMTIMRSAQLQNMRPWSSGLYACCNDVSVCKWKLVNSVKSLFDLHTSIRV